MEFKRTSFFVVVLCLLCETIAEAKEFNVYWNVPTFMCHKHGVYIDVTKFGIIQNTDDIFLGDKVDIWYHPGKFPYLNNGIPVNGGIPQNGSLMDHEDAFRDQVGKLPEDFSGVAVLDFEYYLPSQARSPVEYRQASKKWMSEQHPEYSDEQITIESQRTFNDSIREFMEVALDIGTDMRPNALWGYYHFPYCKNHDGQIECADVITDMNNKTLWLYEASKAMYPSIYLYDTMEVDQRKSMALGRVLEAKRLNDMISQPIAILTYCANKYHDGKHFVTAEDIMNTIGMSKEQGIDGSVIWGSSSCLDSIQKCLDYKDFVETTMGPIVKSILESPVKHIAEALRSRGAMKDMVSDAMDRF
ncbi:hyaluronidase-like [Palaemon carinicauda]|uniref:hyaluronidase-like n=1 Tax=Palaemon carinicauda TaxID=392227 RepID=UPI0035B5F900